jgi:hypothetical protein
LELIFVIINGSGLIFKNLKLDKKTYFVQKYKERARHMILSNSKWRLLLAVLVPLAAVSILSFIVGPAFGQASSQPQQILDRRVEIWALFYRGMVAAFVVGAVVQGAIIYVAWRFRESNKKNMPREPAEGVHR